MNAMLIGGPLHKQIRFVDPEDMDYHEEQEHYRKQTNLSQLADPMPGAVQRINFFRHAGLSAAQAMELISQVWPEVDVLLRGGGISS